VTDGTLTIFKLCFLIVFCAHGFACLMGIITIFADSKLDTWLATHGLCWPINAENATAAASREFACSGAWTQVCIVCGARDVLSALMHTRPA
jgi:hypothetical protein